MNVVKVKSGDSFAIINESDYDPETHELYECGEDAQALADQKETERQLEANRGVVHSGGPSGDDRNASGTFSTPTPTDIRYPDKNETEFENNHGAFIGKSAPDLREEAGLPDAPGGINPQAEEERHDQGRGADDVVPAKPAETQPTEHNPDLPAGDGSGTALREAETDGAGNYVGGEKDSRDDVTIPADWQSSHWRTRVALGEKLSGRDDLNAEEANGIISAEVERRKAQG